ncbi:MAG TPA: polysaccharide lyase [Thermoanaerobaculia bacterium]
MSRRLPTHALLAASAAAVLAAAAAAPRPGVWFCGDFESGGLEGWGGDLARPESAVVVTQPVRKGRHAVRIELAPGDRAANKERAELKIGDKAIERLHGRPGGTMWYGWSLLVPSGYADPPGEQWQILAQWHHRPAGPSAPGERGRVTGAPPLALHLAGDTLVLIGKTSPRAPHRNLGAGAIRRGAWADLVFHIKWSNGSDGFVEAWLDGRPFTRGKQHGATLYGPVANYLRLGLYRPKGVPTNNHVFYDEVCLGESRQAVTP